MEQLKTIKDSLIGVIQGQMGHLEQVDAKELGEVIDMVKDIEEAIYYCTITKAMEEKEKSGGERVHHHYYNRDMDKEEGRMYYDNNMGGFSGNTSSNSGSRHYTELEYPMMRDSREGRSPMSRRTYMESKEMHQPKTTQMKELEKYLQELSSDIVEMIQGASPEEKQLLKSKLTTLISKIDHA